MAHSLKFLAFDLGAESGRVILGRLDDRSFETEEVHRFSIGPVRVGDHLYWDALHIWGEMLGGLTKAIRLHGADIVSMGVDTWGVDFGLLSEDNSLIGNPFHYRDGRTSGMPDRVFKVIPRETLYSRTGLPVMQINSLFQLLSMTGSNALASARTFLNIPDLFNFWLTGRKASEFTIATTTQCYAPREGDWARDLLLTLGIPYSLFQPILPPGTILETLLPLVAGSAGCGTLPVVAVGSHDTASAVAAVPVAGRDYIFISSGTWSLMGVEMDQPMITPRGLALNFANEGGLEGRFLFLKNLTGLWLLQECRREWSNSSSPITYDDLTQMATAALAFRSLIFPGDPRFMPPCGMPGRIQSYCHETGQPVPQTHGEITRCILESLAMEYRRVMGQLTSFLERPIPFIHVIGGGSQNRLLNQFTANATGCTVVAGPVEATALGNIISQAIATGHLGSLQEGRDFIRRSVAQATYDPSDRQLWEEAYFRYMRLVEISENRIPQ
jgi:rhamnulokinase